MMFGWDGGWGWGGWLGMSLVMLLFWGALIALVVYFARRPDDRIERRGPGGDAADADRILDERFARGDIDAEEYTRRRNLLHSR